MGPVDDTFGLSKEFYQLCLDTTPKQLGNQSPVSITSTLTSPTTRTLVKLGINEGSAANSSRLTDHYPDAFTDFHGTPSGAPCIFKTGPAWPKPKGPEAQPYVRELRAVNGHPITKFWPNIRANIGKCLTSRRIKWSSVDAIGFANAGEKKPFCPLLVWLGVLPNTLPFKDAKAAAEYIKGAILSQTGFPGIEVAFRESEATLSVRGPKLLSLDPLLHPVPGFRKPFTPTLGLSIAPLKTPHYEGTGGLFFRLRNDQNSVVLLTAAHVARPPTVYPNLGMTHGENSQPREEIVALGNKGYQDATNAIVTQIGTLIRTSDVWESKITRLRQLTNHGENPEATKRLKEAQQEMDKVKRTIESLDELHSNVTKLMTNPNQRIVGFVLHADPIGVSNDGYMHDWAFIALSEKIDWHSFKGNKIWVGEDLDFGGLMFPHPNDRAAYRIPEDGLLQVLGVVPENEMRHPQQLNVHGDKALPVIKNGMATGTTVGWLNSLESLVRYYPSYAGGPGNKFTAVEVTIVPYGSSRGAFSAKGDSGAVILGRDGRIVALLTGGGGLTDATDVTYGTPYCKLERHIKNVYPSCHLYPVVN
ncbi:hypothetical protein E1B28_003828 [Marasmius oreades]|uniref:Uncharacterized protein n=1 Tax=Marasmius oreades TaxID=181124 RepID=A0A9P7UXB8_9AGAR|nr:uncharacterized protein E1B28_003828 [Marasmius oreades]KAG7096384.1 hypothetical protein E1B28_003828 [Marasmius oreades]